MRLLELVELYMLSRGLGKQCVSNGDKKNIDSNSENKS